MLSSGTLRHKLASTAERKTTLLPFVGFGQLLISTPWAPKWLDAMKRARLPRSSVDYLLPSWNESSSQFIRRRMTSGEATPLHLREILSQMEQPVLHPLPSSHSLKVTLLSWACKSGQFTMVERQIIGHHLDRPSTSALTYGRANFVGPLGKVAGMLNKIHDGSFRPDASAAELIAQQLSQEEAASDELERKLHGEPCICEESASDDMGHDEADQAVVAAVPAAERRMVSAPDPSQFLVHLSSRWGQIGSDVEGPGPRIMFGLGARLRARILSALCANGHRKRGRTWPPGASWLVWAAGLSSPCGCSVAL